MSENSRLDPRAIKRVSGPAWEKMRRQFNAVNAALLGVGSDVRGELTTIYIKYISDAAEADEPFAVLWVKKSTELLLGFSLPEGLTSPHFQEPPNNLKYGQLNRYLLMGVADEVPDDICTWATAAHQHVLSKGRTSS